MTIENQHSQARLLTPEPFARYLLKLVRQRFGVKRVAVLYTSIFGPYHRLRNTLCYPLWAERYLGPLPVIAHPPCGPWGKCRTLVKHQNPQCGIDAIAVVHRNGGVIEQPIGSTLFRQHGRPGARIVLVNQKDWGHPCWKETQLYWVY